MLCDVQLNAQNLTFDELREAADKAISALRDLASDLVKLGMKMVLMLKKAVRPFCTSLYRMIATPREFHLMMYCKKRRTRKKWRAILHRRLIEMMKEASL